MANDRAALHQPPTQAVQARDEERAAGLRDATSGLDAANPDPKPVPEMGPSKLRRQEPGKMGLGTSDQKFKPPEGWKPPKRPDMMTANTKPRRGGR